MEGNETITVSGANAALTVTGTSLTLTDDDGAPAIDLSVNPGSVAEDAGATAVTVTAEFSNAVTYATDTTVTVGVGAGGDSAVSGTDYGAVSGFTVTIPAGRTSGSAPFTLTPTDDTLVEGNETITVSGTNAALTVNGTSLTLTDDDEGAADNLFINLSADPARLAEDAGATAVTVTAEFSATVTYPTDTTVTVSAGDSGDSAVSGTDYGAVSDFTITIPAGRTSGSASFTLTPTDDTLVEGNETITVSGTNAALTVNGTSLTLTDDDRVAAASLVIDLSVNPASVAEAAGATAVTVTAEFSATVTYATDRTVTVSVGASGDGAVSGTDYTAVSDFDITIAAGRTSGSATFTLTPAQDTLVEGNEAITVSGANAALTVNGTSLTLTDDDGDPAVNLSASPSSVSEGAGATTVTVTATFSNSVTYNTAKTVTVSLGDGTDSATSGTDYTAVSDFDITIAAGRTSGSATFTLTPTQDTLVEGNETITVSGANAALTVTGTSLTLTDDDGAPAIDLSVNPGSVAEDAGATAVTVTAEFSNAVTYATDTTVTVGVGAGGDSAVSGTDYGAVSGFTVTIPAGRTSGSAPFTLTPTDDTLVEGNETITVSGTNAALTVNGTSLTLTDDEEPVSVPESLSAVVLSANPSTVSEDAGATTVTVTATVSDGEAFADDRTVTVSVGAGGDGAVSGTDYGAVSDFTITIPAGRTSGSASFTLTPTDDTPVEGDETITVAGANATLTVNGTSMTLTDDDRVVKASVADATAEEGRPLRFTVKLERALPDKRVTMNYATEDGTAKAGEDYTAVSGSLTFAPGKTERVVEVPTLDDPLDEGSETFTLRLSGAVNASLADPDAVGTITNDDQLPGAWIARFGRTASGHVMEAVEARLHGGDSGAHLTVGGVSAGWPEDSSSSAGSLNPAGRVSSGWTGRGRDASTPDGYSIGGEQEMSSRELLAGTAFRWTSMDAASESQRRWTAWGSGATTRFDGREGPVTLEGEMVGFTLGMDTQRGPWTAGIALGYNDGEGSFDDAKSGDRGELETTLMSAHPYLRWTNGRLSVWGLLGHGQGEYVTTPERLGRAVQTDLNMNMAGMGARRTLAAVAGIGGAELALRSDAMFVWMQSDAVAGHLRETKTRTSHLRLLLESGWAFKLGDGMLTPTMEVGLRHDGGDAETGSGLEVGGALRYAAGRLTIEVSARGLAAHEERDFGQWGVSGSIRLDPEGDGRGLSMKMGSSRGASSGSAEGVWARQYEGLSSRVADPQSRFDAEVAYGFAATRGLLTPYTGVTVSGGDETWRAGVRWKLAPTFDVSIEASLREPAADEDPENAILLRGSWRW